MGNNSLLRGKGWRMTDEGTKVTLRMGPEVIQMMEDFMDEHDIGNRSDFIRDAIKGYIDSQRNGGFVASGSGIFVRFSDLQMDALQGLVQRGICLSEEEFVRKCVLDRIVPATVEEEAVADSFRTAQRNAALK